MASHFWKATLLNAPLAGKEHAGICHVPFVITGIGTFRLMVAAVAQWRIEALAVECDIFLLRKREVRAFKRRRSCGKEKLRFSHCDAMLAKLKAACTRRNGYKCNHYFKRIERLSLEIKQP